ncbi:right-handed parallel beta-helix repeat-containing protein [Streptomyces sp. NPDC053431]|uniref:right-handed parallel beta-helix repeat-containing protein n=1 Tax=Streptomyces sp. NPDC053431 TaxID=3365703 RepID=UPI0037CFB385
MTATAVAAVAAVVGVPTGAAAQEFVPCGQAALKSAIAQANAAPGPSLLILSPGCLYTVTTPHNASNGLPVITSQITLVGNGSTIRRSTQTGTPDFRLFEVSGPNGDLRLGGLTVRNGRLSTGYGGGVWVHDGGRLSVDRSKVVHNYAHDGGGGIASASSTVSFSNSDLMYNVSTGDGAGYLDYPQSVTTFRNSTVGGNTALSGQGGGIEVDGRLTVSDSRVVENAAGADGGGIMIAPDANVTLTNTVVRSNSSAAIGGGINTYGTLQMTGGEVFANRVTEGAIDSRQGGGIANRGGSVTLNSTRVTNNAALNAPGGILNSGGQVVLNSTIVAENLPTNCDPGTVPGCTG